MCRYWNYGWFSWSPPLHFFAFSRFFEVGLLFSNQKTNPNKCYLKKVKANKPLILRTSTCWVRNEALILLPIVRRKMVYLGFWLVGVWSGWLSSTKLDKYAKAAFQYTFCLFCKTRVCFCRKQTLSAWANILGKSGLKTVLYRPSVTL